MESLSGLLKDAGSLSSTGVFLTMSLSQPKRFPAIVRLQDQPYLDALNNE